MHQSQTMNTKLTDHILQFDAKTLSLLRKTRREMLTQGMRAEDS